jgi:hypothetical protein
LIEWGAKGDDMKFIKKWGLIMDKKEPQIGRSAGGYITQHALWVFDLKKDAEYHRKHHRADPKRFEVKKLTISWE